ncbi:5-oxoprolinase subunit PxpA [Paenibacillus thailandensis]|uniref:5-oxoprolinase subunit A n=1 Tax=Paenibacillus thailandensis TaxID=393250 RepID=A0ABW5QTW7_9BACL
MTANRKETVDLNCDYGEGFGAYRFGGEEELLSLVTSVNIACGFHAGDPHTMRESVERALAAGVATGAHPGLPDRLGFGRREMAVSPGEVYDFVLYQVGALQAFANAAGSKLRHVKPHGALYHMANRDGEIAEAIVKAAAAIDKELILYAQSGSLLLETAERLGMNAASEVFADRTYEPGGGLTPRSRRGASLAEPEAAARQAVSMVVHGRAFTPEGGSVPVRADTICLHGDGPHAAAMAAAVRSALAANGVRIAPLHKK